jgi:hypothetical protein
LQQFIDIPDKISEDRLILLDTDTFQVILIAGIMPVTKTFL